MGGGVGKVVGGGVGKVVGGAVGEAVETRWTKGGVEPETPETKKKRGLFGGFKKEKSQTPNWHSSTNSLDSELNDNHHNQTPNPKPKNNKQNEMAICEEPKIQDEANTVKKMVGDYLDIVHTTMMDLAPKYIMHFLVRALQKYLDDDMLLAKLLKLHSTEEGVDQLMQWEAGSQVSRLLADREAIREALDVVAGYSQNQETVTTG